MVLARFFVNNLAIDGCSLVGLIMCSKGTLHSAGIEPLHAEPNRILVYQMKQSPMAALDMLLAVLEICP